MSKETIIKISRSKYIEESLETALLRLDNMFHYKGVLCMINYYTSSLQDSFDTIFASGVSDGVGKNNYKIISLHQDNIIWGAGDFLPDVSRLVHGEKYLYRDERDDWWLVQISADGRTRHIERVPPGPTTYECLSDNSKWVVDSDQVARRITDIYSRGEIDEMFDLAINTVKYVDFDSLSPAQIEQIRGHKGDQGDKGDPGPMGPQGRPGIRGYNGTIENFVVLTEAEYRALEYKDPYKFYFTYEDEDVPPIYEFTAYVDGTTLVITADVEENTISINPAYASYDDNMLSIVASSTTVSTPILAPIPGTYDGAKTIEIICQTPGSTIHYTTDWTEPTEHSPIYYGPITLDASGTIKAIGVKSGMLNSRVVTGTYDLLFPDTVAIPTITPASGNFNAPVDVTIGCSTSGATIRYTLDGSEPNEASFPYLHPFIVSDVINTVRARAFKPFHNGSNTATEIYEINTQGRVETPGFSIPSGTYTTPQPVIIYTQTLGATIRYTLDGSEPTPNSSIYSGPIVISESTTIKAKGFATGMISSNVATLDIIISDIPPTPPTPGEDVVVNGETIDDRQPEDRVIGDTWFILTTPYPTVINKTLIF